MSLQRRSRRGFGLLETLIAVVIALIIYGVIYAIFSGGLRSTHRGTELLTSVRDFNLLGETLRKDARSVLVSPETPVTVSADGSELAITVVVGVTSDGVPVGMRVVYRFEPGTTGDPPLGTLLRIADADGTAPRTTRHFINSLVFFSATKYAGEADPLPDDDPTPPAFIECLLADGRGTLFSSRFHLYSRYSRIVTIPSTDQHWLANYRVRPVRPTSLIISELSDAVIEVDTASLRIVGGIAMDSGSMVTGALR